MILPTHAIPAILTLVSPVWPTKLVLSRVLRNMCSLLPPALIFTNATSVLTASLEALRSFVAMNVTSIYAKAALKSLAPSTHMH